MPGKKGAGLGMTRVSMDSISLAVEWIFFLALGYRIATLCQIQALLAITFAGDPSHLHRPSNIKAGSVIG